MEPAFKGEEITEVTLDTKKTVTSKKDNQEEKVISVKEVKNTPKSSVVESTPNEVESLSDNVLKKKQVDHLLFFKKSRHFFIMADGGQPIYTRYGNAIDNNGIFATLFAIISKFTQPIDPNERFHYYSNEKINCVFIKRGELFLVALTKKKENPSFLSQQLEILYLLLVSILGDRMRRLEQNPNSCAVQLGQTDEIFENMIKYSSRSMCALLNSYPIFQIDGGIRQKVTNALEANKGNALISLVITKFEIISIVGSKDVEINANDLILVQNLILSSPSMIFTESWVPVCLPGISPDGFLQLYCNFLDSRIGVVFVTERNDDSRFLEFVEQSRNVFEELDKEEITPSIKTLVDYHSKSKAKLPKIIVEYSAEQLVEEFLSSLANVQNKVNDPKDPKDIMENVKLLICKHKNSNQYFTYKFNNFELITEDEKATLQNYCKLYDMYKSSSSVNSNNFFHYIKDDLYTNSIHVNENYILFASFSLFTEFDDIYTMILEIIKGIKVRETFYFIKKIPS